MSVENEAFIDLENMLHERTDRLWRILWRDLQRDLIRLANEGRWDEALDRTNNIDFSEIVADLLQLARTAAEASLFLGASRVDDPEKASFFGEPDEHLIDRAVEQWRIVLERNATEALRIQARNTLADLERKFAEEEATRIVKADPDLSKVGKAGTQFSRATASLMISRMSTMGFLLEASVRGQQFYRVNEVMDAATCPVCATMHNKHFPVQDGLAQASAIMSASDPESLKAVAPFPSQSRANIKSLQNMGQGQLINAGMHLPPYHPNCRGIVTLEDKNSRASLSAGDSALGLAAGERLVSTDALTPDELNARMFGDFADLEDGLLGAILGAGAAAEFFTEPQGDDQ